MKKLKNAFRKLGEVGVDSGGLIIVDPCYLSKWKDGEYGKNNHYTKACKARDNENRGSEVLVSGVAGNGVSFTSGYGDGVYPVLAHYNGDGVIDEVVIKLA